MKVAIPDLISNSYFPVAARHREHFDPNVVDAFSRLLVGGALVELGAKARPAEALSSAEVAEALQPAASEGTGVTT